MHITPFGEKTFHLITLLAISMAECLIANKILYCNVLYCMRAANAQASLCICTGSHEHYLLTDATGTNNSRAG